LTSTTAVLPRLITCLLLAMIPLTGIHMVCIGGPGAAALTVGASDGAGCEETCARRKPSTATSTTKAEPPAGCVLVADGCSLLLPGMIAVVPAQSTFSFELAARPLEAVRLPLYLAPPLAHTSPPPKI